MRKIAAIFSISALSLSFGVAGAQAAIPIHWYDSAQIASTVGSPSPGLDYPKEKNCSMLGIRNYPVTVTWRDTAGSRRPYKTVASTPSLGAKISQVTEDFVDGSTLVKRYGPHNYSSPVFTATVGDFANGSPRSAAHNLMVKFKIVDQANEVCHVTIYD